MAALEKIRKRAAILTIVIGAGLLAFILEEAVRASGAFTSDTLAAKVGNEKIEMQEFQNKSQEMQKQQDPDSKTDPAVTQQQILQGMIQEKLVSQECEESNIVVTGSEVADLMIKNPPQSIVQLCQQNGVDPQTLLNTLKNPGNINPNDPGFQQVRALYESEAQNMELQLKQAKLATLLMGCMQANDIDINLTKEESEVYDITYAKVDYTTVDDKLIKVTDAELKEAYNKYKEIFKINDETRRVHYIKVDIDPSSNDKAAATKKVDAILASLQNSNGIEGIRSNSDIVLDSLTTTMNDKNLFASNGKSVPKDDILKQLIEGGLNTCSKKEPTGRDRDTYIYKVTRTFESIDSIGLDMVQVIGDKNRQDSVMALLEKGKSIDSLATENNPNIHVQKSNKQQLARAFQLPDSLRTKINNNADGKFFVFQSSKEGAVIAKVAQSKAKTTFYSIARAKFTDYPSEATLDGLRAKLQKYINTNKNIAAFEKNAKNAGFEISEQIIDPSTTQLGAQQSQFGMMPGIKESRRAVKWAYENKPGAISQIFDSDTELLVVAVDAVYKDYMPFDDPTIKKRLTELVKNEKKGEYLMKQYKGKANSLDAYAKLMKVEKIDSAQVSMGAPQQMLEGKVAGLIAGLGAKGKGQLQVIAGRNAFYVVQVNNITPARELPKQQLAEQYRQRFPVQQMFQAILQGSRKVKNNLIKFS